MLSYLLVVIFIVSFGHVGDVNLVAPLRLFCFLYLSNLFFALRDFLIDFLL